MSDHGPMHQFEVVPIIKMKLANIDVSFTNSSLYMLLTVISIFIFFIAAMRNRSLVPGRLQSSAEICYEFVANIIKDNIGTKGMEYMPLIFSIFMFVVIANLLGMTPYGFTVTSHIAVTFSLAIFIFLFCTIIGFIKHGKRFFSLFLPEGIPLLIAPFMIIIELFTYLARPFTLSIRLAGNMVAGHVLMKVLASFVVGMGIYFGWIPIPLMIVLSGFEIFVAILQAYIFTVLTCVYLNDAINLH